MLSYRYKQCTAVKLSSMPAYTIIGSVALCNWFAGHWHEIVPGTLKHCVASSVTSTCCEKSCLKGGGGGGGAESRGFLKESGRFVVQVQPQDVGHC